MKKYTMKVYPAGLGREAWRTFEISGTETLDGLCEYILALFEFYHEHLYEFCMDNKMYSEYSYQYQPEYGEPSTDIRLDKLGLVKGQIFSLHYDFGDDWMFRIRVQKIEDVKGKVSRALLKSKGEVEQYPDYDEFDEDEESEEEE